MILYMFYVFTCIFVAFILPYLKIKSMRQSWIIIILLIVGNSILAGTRSFDLPDTEVYRTVYDNSISIIESGPVNSLKDILFNREYNSIELGFIFLMYLSKISNLSFRMFLALISILTSFMFIKGIELIIRSESCDIACYNKNVPKMLILSWVYFIMFDGILYTSIVLRSGLSLAAGIMFLGMMRNCETNKILAMVFLLFSVLVHSTGITWILIYFLWSVFPRIVNKRIFIATWIFLLIGYFFNMAKHTIMILIEIVKWLLVTININAFGSYFTELEFIVQKREYLIIFLVGLVCIICYKDKRIIRRCALLVLLGFSIFTFAYPIGAISREADYFISFFVPIAAVTIMTKRKWKQYIINLLMLSFMIPQFFMIWGNV